MQKSVFLSVFHENTNKSLGFGEDLAIEDCDLILYLPPAIKSRTRPRTQSRALLQVKTLFSSVKIGRSLQNTAANITNVIKHLDAQAARDVVIKYAGTLSDGHPLCRHLGGRRFLSCASHEKS